MGLTYKDSGVDTVGGSRFVQGIKGHVQRTFTERVITDIGGFGALYSGSFPEMKEPVLVSGTDGVGTKLKIAQLMGKHSTIGVDAVAMCVNDIITSGAKPLFFLDYISCGKLQEDVLTDVVKGISDGCVEAECSLIGGETAEHPGVMGDNEYDIAGFSVGVVDKEKIINGCNIAPGDVIIGVESSGIHANGYSLVRKLLLEIKGYSLDKTFNDIEGSLGDTLLTPTKLYTKAVHNVLSKNLVVNGIIHITGGGFYENIPRILPESCAVSIDTQKINPLPIFSLIQAEGKIDPREMYSTFNMGIGLMVIVNEKVADSTINLINAAGYNATIIGHTVKKEKESVILNF